jgi:hypothetical protein
LFFSPARQDYPNKAINQLYIVAVPLKSSAVSQPRLPPVRPKMRLSRSGFRWRIDASAVAVSKIAAAGQSETCQKQRIERCKGKYLQVYGVMIDRNSI